MTSRLSSLSIVFVLGALGCAASNVASEPVPEEDWVRAYSEARCEQRFRCCTVEEREAWGALGPLSTSAEECVAEAVELREELFGDAERDPRARYDAAVAGRCVAAISALTCEEYVDALSDRGTRLAACDGLFVPTVEDGGACTVSAQCVSGFCDQPSFPEEGVCASPPTEGEPCHDVCADGLFCDLETEICRARLADGAECVVDDYCVNDCVGRDPRNIYSRGTCGVRTTCAP